MKQIIGTINKVIGPVVAGFWSHLHLYRYGAFLYRKSRRQPHIYSNEQDFWKDLLGKEFYTTKKFRGSADISEDGCTGLEMHDVIILKNFQISEWFPRCPGLFWTKNGTLNRKAAESDIEGVIGEFLVYGEKGKNNMMSGGIGTNRLSTHRDVSGKPFRVLCATSSGICDAGIPIVVPEDVCSAILDPLMSGEGIEIDIEGTLSWLPFDNREIIIPARGAVVEDELRNWLMTSLHIPRYFLFVGSTLQVKRYISDFRLRASGWTVYEKGNREDYTPSFTYATFDPSNKDTIRRATDFMTDYVEGHGGKEIYTDFDEHVPRFNAKYSINDIMGKKVDPEKENSDLQRIISWAKSVKRYKRY